MSVLSKNTTNWVAITLLLVGLFACSSEKKGFIPRTYHSTVSLFNGFYHANEKYKEGVVSQEKAFKTPEVGLMPLIDDGSSGKNAVPQFDEAIEKCDVIIFRHKNGKWVDNSYYLKGKAEYQKGHYTEAIVNFEYIIGEYKGKCDFIPQTYIWLAKTYFAQKSFYRADEIINQLKKEYGALIEKDPKLKVELAEISATLAIKNEKYKEAHLILEENLPYVKKKKRRVKWQYLLAQLYDLSGNFKQSFEYFNKTIEANVDNETNFRAKLCIARLYVKYQPEDPSSTEAVSKMLRDLLKDVKYEDFHDQIYYQYALVEYKNNNLDGCLKNLKLAIAKNKGNNEQKALAYFKAGEIYFYKKQNFDSALAYFDSAAVLIEASHPDYDKISSISKTLKKYDEYRKTIHLQDSLLVLASLTPDAMKKKVEGYVEWEEKRKKADKERQEREEKARAMAGVTGLDPSLMDPNNPNAIKNTGNGSDFYFDNQALVIQGKAQFQSLWGQRPNEDNWRRRNKMAQQTADTSADAAPDPDDKVAYKKYLEDKKTKYLANIPQTEEDKAAAKEKLIGAMFNLAQTYSQKLSMPDSAVKWYLTITRRFPESDYTPKSYYAVYTLYNGLKSPQEKKYKEIILDQFPTSIYAKLIRKEKIAPTEKDAQNFREAYNTAYGLFQAGDYETVLTFSNFVLENHLENPEIAKVYYLRGLCYGYLQQMDSLRTNFKFLKKNFPTADVTPVAAATLKFLDKDETPEPPPVKPGGPQAGGANPNADAAPGEMKFDPRQGREPIIGILLVKKDLIKSNDLNVLLAKMHERLFKNDNLKSNIFLYQPTGGEYHLAYISTFNEATLADTYLKACKEDKEIAKLLPDFDNQAFFITNQNFRNAFSKKKFEAYAKYFKAHKAEMLSQ